MKTHQLVLRVLLTGVLGLSISAHCAPSFSFVGSWSQSYNTSLQMTIDKTTSTLKATIPIDTTSVGSNALLSFHFEADPFGTAVGIVPDMKDIQVGPLAMDPNWHMGTTSANLVAADDVTAKKTTSKLSWTSNTLTLSITSEDLLAGLDDAFLFNLDPEVNKFVSPYYLTVQFGQAASYSHAFDLTGANTGKEIQNDVYDAVLNSGSFSATMDFTPPVVTVANPKTFNATSAPVHYSGSSKSKHAIASVQYLSSGATNWSSCDGMLTNWSFYIGNPLPGINQVLIKATDNYGNESAAITNEFILLVTNQLSLVYGSIPATNVALGSISGVVNGQGLVAGQTYAATAIPKKNAGAIFLSWTDGNGNLLATTPTLKWRHPGKAVGETVTIKANFAIDPYPILKGTYSGLFHGDIVAEDSISNAGSINLTVTPTGSFSGKLTTLQGMTSLTGQFVYDDWGSGPEARKSVHLSSPDRWVNLRLDLSNGIPTLAGDVSSSSDAAILAYQTASTVKSNPWAASYTAGLGDFTDPLQTNVTWGNGYGTAIVGKNGSASMVLTLPDKTTVAGVSPGFLSTNNPAIPFFVPLYGNKGFVIGWADFSTSANNTNDLLLSAENVVWYKAPAIAKQTTYLGGFLASGPLNGVSFQKTNGLANAQGTLHLQGDATSLLSEPITANWSYTVAKGFVFTNVSSNASQLKMTLAPATGVITGSVIVTPPSGPKTTVNLNGAVITPKSGLPIVQGFAVPGSSSCKLEMEINPAN